MSAEGSGPAGTLYVTATPIGNLEDTTFRTVRVLSSAALILAEDTRRTRKLLEHYKIPSRILSCHAHNARARLPAVIDLLTSGRDVALVSDAGTPGVSDPGLVVVRGVHDAGFRVTPVPGASAAVAALSAAGLPGEGFRFVGFLPRQPSRRRARLNALVQDPSVLILYEAPNRVQALLEDLRDTLGPDREAALCRELTKVHEEIRRGALDTLSREPGGPLKGEITVVIAGAPTERSEGEAVDEASLRKILRVELAKGLTLREAAGVLSRQLGLPRREVYSAGLKELKAE